jgi:hypothetical protein
MKTPLALFLLLPLALAAQPTYPVLTIDLWSLDAVALNTASNRIADKVKPNDHRPDDKRTLELTVWQAGGTNYLSAQYQYKSPGLGNAMRNTLRTEKVANVFGRCTWHECPAAVDQRRWRGCEIEEKILWCDC